MPRRTLVLGGARSGKSHEAERRLAAFPDVVYVATAGTGDGDPEWSNRVAAHVARRPPTWRTVETCDLEPLLGSDGPPLLIDCLTLWLTNVMDGCQAWDDEIWFGGGEQALHRRVEELTAAWRSCCRTVVAVSNEIGSGVVPPTASGRRFRDELGRLNTALAAESDEVLLTVAGLVLPLRQHSPAPRPLPKALSCHDVSAVNLDTYASLVERPHSAFQAAAEQQRRQLLPPAPSLGRLGELGEWLAAVQGRCPTVPLEVAKVVLFAGDHGVARQGVSALPADATPGLVRAAIDGATTTNTLARRYGARVRVVDICVDCDPAEFPADVVRHRVRRGSGRIDTEDATTVEEAARAFGGGVAIANEEADSGTDIVLLGDLGVGGTTVASLLIAALCGTDAAAVTGRGSGIDDLTWMRKCAAIRDALRRARPVLGDQMQLLATSAGADFAAMTGFLLQCSVRRTPVLLDGVVSAACALLAQRIAFRSADWWQAGHASGEPAQAKALDRLSLEPILDRGVSTGGAVGALLALPLLQAAADLLADSTKSVNSGATN